MATNKNYYNEVEINTTMKIKEITQQLPQYVRAYFLSISQKKKILTQLGYARDIKVFFQYLQNRNPMYKEKKLTDIPIEDLGQLSPTDIEEYMDYLKAFELDGVFYNNHEEGIARKVSSINGLFTFLVKREYIKNNPVSNVERPTLHTKQITILTSEQISKLLDEIENGEHLSNRQKLSHEKTWIRDFAIIMTFLGTGIRVSELVGLDLNDLDMETMTLRVIRKGGDEDIVYFNDEVADALLLYLSEREVDIYDENDLPVKANLSPRQQLLPYANSPEPALFISLKGNRMAVRSVQAMVQKYSSIVAANKKISPHKLRDTFATSLYTETDGDAYTVSKSLGHKNIETSKKYIAFDNERKKASQRLTIRSDK